MNTYSGMLSGQYRTRTNTLVEPPMSQEFVYERVQAAAGVIMWEALRRHLWSSARNPKMRNNAVMILEYLKIAEEAEHVGYKLVVYATERLLRFTTDELYTAEPPHQELIGEVFWLGPELHALVEPIQDSIQMRIAAKHRELRAELYPGEGAQAEGTQTHADDMDVRTPR